MGRRKLNEIVGAKSVHVAGECEEEKDSPDTMSENEMRFPIRRTVESEEDNDSDCDAVTLPAPKAPVPELRRSKRKASLRATQNLMKEKPIKKKKSKKKKKTHTKKKKKKKKKK